MAGRDFVLTLSSGEEISGTAPEGATQEQIIDNYKKQTAKKAEKLPPSDESIPMQALRGFTEPVRGAVQLFHEITPGPTHKEGPPPSVEVEGRKIEPKVKQPDPMETTPASLLGSVVGPAGVAGAAARVLPKAGGLLASASRAAAGGALGGALQPVDGDNFWKTKAEQVGIGATLGFGFGVGGKVLNASANAIVDQVRKHNPALLEDQAVLEIVNRINIAHKHGGPSAQDVLDLVNKLNAMGKPATLADVQEIPTLQSLAGRTARSSPEGQSIANFMERRDTGKGFPTSASDRLDLNIAQHLYSGPSAYQTTKMLTAAQKAASKPLYEKTDELQNIWSPRLQQFLSDPHTPYIRAGLNRGFKLEAADALAEGRPFDPTMMGVDLDQEGNVKIVRSPNMRVLDMVKRGMDAIIAENRNFGKLNTEGRQVAKLRKAWIDEVDKLDTKGVYKAARDAWSGPEAAKDAIQLGRSAFDASVSPEELADNFSKLSKGDREFARVGIADIMRERLIKARFNTDESKQLLKNPWMQKQMRPFFKSSGDYDQFTDKVLAEGRLAESKNTVLRGSQTAARTAEDTTMPFLRTASAGKIIARAVEGRLFSAVSEMWRLHRDIKMQADPELDAAMAKILFAPDIGNTPIGMRLLESPEARPPSVFTQSVVPAAAAGSAQMVTPQRDLMQSQ